MSPLEQLIVLSVVKPQTLPHNINLVKLGILDEKTWGQKDNKDENKKDGK